MCRILTRQEGRTGYYENPEVKKKPIVDSIVIVGSFYARTFQEQDYWQTTPIKEILEDSETYVKFRTYNSVYEWTKE
jgi:hypothetical protein